MWLSQVWNRGYDRMRKIFCGLLTITGWARPFSAYTEAFLPSAASTGHIVRAGDPHQQLRQGDLFTTTVRLSTSRSKTPETNSG